MTQKIYKYFGIRLALDNEIDAKEYKNLVKKIAKRIKEEGTIDENKVEIYIHKLNISIKERHLGIAPVESRLASLNVTLQLSKSAIKSEKIEFLNRQIAAKDEEPEVKVEPKKHMLSYTLTGKYCHDHTSYSDYIATLVLPDCPAEFKSLDFKSVATPTEVFRRKLNHIGPVITKFQFSLTKDIQITLAI